MEDKGIKTALKSSEVQRQTEDFSKKSSDFQSSDLFDDPTSSDNSSKGLAFSDETSGLGLQQRGVGRPKGAKNKSTKEWVEYFMATVKESPLIFLGKLMTEPTDRLARRMCADRIDALKVQVGAANALLPYVHQKQPVAVEVKSEELPTIQIFTSSTLFNQINNGNNQLKKEIIVDGIASTINEEISINNNELALLTNSQSEKKV